MPDVLMQVDRLGRNLRHLVNTVHDLTDGGIGLRVLTGQGAATDTTGRGKRRRYRPGAPITFGLAFLLSGC